MNLHINIIIQFLNSCAHSSFFKKLQKYLSVFHCVQLAIGVNEAKLIEKKSNPAVTQMRSIKCIRARVVHNVQCKLLRDCGFLINDEVVHQTQVSGRTSAEELVLVFMK